LVDTAGSVVGIDTAATGGASSDSVGFAIPFTPALATAEAIIAGSPRPGLALGSQAYTGYLGVQVVGATPRGARIVQVEHASPAERAGLRSGETITAINIAPAATPAVPAHPIATTSQLTALLGRLHPGMQVAVTLTGPNAPTAPLLVTLGTGAAR
jgi:S1-C subfamily serine protease